MLNKYPIGLGTAVYNIYDRLSKTNTLSIELAQELQTSIAPFNETEGLNQKEKFCIQQALDALEQIIKGEHISVEQCQQAHDTLLQKFHSLLY